jgi:hypothetical protein
VKVPRQHPEGPVTTGPCQGRERSPAFASTDQMSRATVVERGVTISV